VTVLPPPVEPNPATSASFDLDDIFGRLTPSAQLEVRNAVLTIQLEQAHARIAELEQGAG
jgi:hypothetical protein